MRLRFAPSPSGQLHIGNARTAIFNWLWARRMGGQFILRIEDTDQERSSLESVRTILEDLKWLGLDWDEGPEKEGTYGPYFQSERKQYYRQYTEQLVEQGLAYRCYCSKEELDELREAARERDPKTPFRYPGIWRDRTDWPANQPYVVRFKSPRTGSTRFNDKVFGEIVTPNAEQQDFVIVRRDGLPLYNFAAVVDDHLMDISLVARGRDHIGSTSQQILLYEALGWPPPEFAHLPMMLSKKGEKLSKRHGSVTIGEYRQEGYAPSAVLNALSRFGWAHGDQEIFSQSELIASFDWAGCGRKDGRFDPIKFLDVNFSHLKSTKLCSNEEYLGATQPFLAMRDVKSIDESVFNAALPMVRPRAQTFVDAANAMGAYLREYPEMDAKAAKKFLTTETAPYLEAFIHFATDLPESSWTQSALESAFQSWLAKTGLQLKEIGQPLRVALMGRKSSPGLADVLGILGKEISLKRVRAAYNQACASS